MSDTTANWVRGEESVAYETKVILTLLAERVSQARTVKEAYRSIARAASSEGVKLPTFEEMKAEIAQDGEE